MESDLAVKLWDAAYSGEEESVKEILKDDFFQNGENLDFFSNNEWKCSPLWIACYMDNKAVAQILLEHGSDKKNGRWKWKNCDGNCKGIRLF